MSALRLASVNEAPRRRTVTTFRRRIPIEEAFRALALGEIDAAIGAARSSAPAADRIHDVRTDCKRLRALLRLVRPAFPAFEAENAAIRELAAGLAHTRDAAVMNATLGRLLGKRGRSPASGRGIEAAAPDEEAEAAALSRFLPAARELRQRAAGWALTSRSLRVLAGGAGETYRGAWSGMGRARRSGRPADFHEWRKETKYLLYQREFLAGLRPHVFPPVKAITRLGDLLGRHHDLQVLRDYTARHGHPDMDEIERLAAARQVELGRRALRLGRSVLVEKPKRWGARLGARLEA